jgi:hypothetical protein
LGKQEPDHRPEGRNGVKLRGKRVPEGLDPVREAILSGRNPGGENSSLEVALQDPEEGSRKDRGRTGDTGLNGGPGRPEAGLHFQEMRHGAIAFLPQVPAESVHVQADMRPQDGVLHRLGVEAA